MDRTTECLWQLSLQRLCSSVPKRRPAATGDVKTVSEVDLPDDARRVLSLRLKFAVEPRMSAPELLGLVRAVSRCAPVDEVERCISEGVDVLPHNNQTLSHVPVKRVASILKERRLSVLAADKDGGFVVLTVGEFGSKALEAISSVFTQRQDVSLKKHKVEGDLCNR